MLYIVRPSCGLSVRAFLTIAHVPIRINFSRRLNPSNPYGPSMFAMSPLATYIASYPDLPIIPYRGIDKSGNNNYSNFFFLFLGRPFSCLGGFLHLMLSGGEKALNECKQLRRPQDVRQAYCRLPAGGCLSFSIVCLRLCLVLRLRLCLPLIRRDQQLKQPATRWNGRIENGTWYAVLQLTLLGTFTI